MSREHDVARSELGTLLGKAMARRAMQEGRLAAIEASGRETEHEGFGATREEIRRWIARDTEQIETVRAELAKLPPPTLAMGIDLRVYLAGRAMQGLLAGTDMRYVVSGPRSSGLHEVAERTAADAVAFADALVAALARSEAPTNYQRTVVSPPGATMLVTEVEPPRQIQRDLKTGVEKIGV